MESIAIRKYFPNFRSVCCMAVWWWCAMILCHNSRSERIVVVHGFRSIIIDAWPRPERRRHHHHHDRYPRQRRNNNVALLVSNKMVPNVIAEEKKEAIFISSDSNDVDDANNVASLRSVTFSHLPKDQGLWYMDLCFVE